MDVRSSTTAVSILLTPFQIGGEETGFVLFGTRLAGTPNVITGLYLLVYVYGIWNMKRFAVGMAHAYALYVILNLLMFMFRDAEGADQLGILGSTVYSGITVGVSLGSAIMLTKRNAELA